MNALIEADQLARHYHVRRGLFAEQGLVRALDGVSFRLDAGRTLAVVGESGCGKTTLARLVTMIDRPTGGTLRIDGQAIEQADRPRRRALRPLVSMVFQNPQAQLNPRWTVGTLLGEPLAINTDLGRAARREAAAAMLARVGLQAEHLDRYPHMFSGGQRQRIAIARALMLSPRVVVADEPVSALDVSVQAQVLNLLLDLQQQTGVAYLFVSHNLQVVRRIADDVLVMYLGRVVETGPKAALFARPAHPYTRALLAATPQLARSQQTVPIALSGEPPSPLAPPSGCAFHPRCPYAIERCRIEEPALAPLGTQGIQVACLRAAELNP